MLKPYIFFFSLFTFSFLQSQGVLLPTDFRQHNLTEYNSSLLSPVFALDRNNPQSLALWTRWQWQDVDGDPTTLFLNYTRRLDAESVGGVGFFQNNTGTFLQSGGALNYAYALELKSRAQIAFGLNLFGFVRKLADDRFQQDPDAGLPPFSETSDFILRLAPSLRFKLDRFSIGIVAENLMDYNFTTKEKETRPTEKIYIGLASYNFPITIFGTSETSFLQPTVYMKTLPGLDNQFGFTTLFSTPKFWVQTGINSFYGLSGGVGGRFFKKLSIGALMEFGTSTKISGTDPSFEFVTAFNFGSGAADRKALDLEEEEEEEMPEIITENRADEKIGKETPAEDGIAIGKKEQRRLKKEVRLAEKQQRKDSIEVQKEEKALAEELSQQKTFDSIAEARSENALEEARKLAAQKEKDASVASQREKDLAETKQISEQKTRDSLAKAREEEKLARPEQLAQQKDQNTDAARRKAEEAAELAIQKRRDSLAEIRKRERLEAVIQEQRQQVQDSIAAAREQEKIAEAARLKQQKTRDSLDAVMQVEKAEELAVQRRRDSLAEIRKRERLEAVNQEQRQRVQDSIAAAQETLAEAARLKEQKSRDSLAELRKAGENRLLAMQERRDSLAELKKQERAEAVRRAEEQRVQDSIAVAKEREQLVEAARVKRQKAQDSLAAIRKAAEIRELSAQKTRDSIEELRRLERLEEVRRVQEKHHQDSIAAVQEREQVAEAMRIKRQKTQDSLAKVREQERMEAVKQTQRQQVQDSVAKTAEKSVVTPKEGERYEETGTENGLEPGFYLIANVFGTKKYLDKFMSSLKEEGLSPGSFYRSLNKYNYVYLQRYSSITEARKARDSQFNGRYNGKTWIFRVMAN